MFLSPTNALHYYTYKMLKYTVKISHDCSHMFRSIWTIIREPMPNLAKVTILCRHSAKICRQMSSNASKSVSSCGVYCVLCSLWLKTNSAIWFNKICKIKNLKPNYINIKINGNKQRDKKTTSNAVRYRINQEIKFVYRKKQNLNHQLYQ